MEKLCILDFLVENNYHISSNSLGLRISLDDNELKIVGSQLDLIEFADYLVSIALSDSNRDHIHLDELTLLDKGSDIKSLIIEKDM